MSSTSLLPSLKEDLVRVEERLLKETVSELGILTEIARHLIPAGGKLTRPGFTITASFLGGPEQRREQRREQRGGQAQTRDGKVSEEVTPVSEEIITGATAVELVHLGSLYHDDVMDSAETRRNIVSVNAKYGEHTAILAGDFLLARASILATTLGVRVSALLASTIARLCEGQIIEHREIYNLDRTPEAYMQAIEGKTAALLSTACEIGTIVTGGDEFSEQIAEFGLAYGMAFQIVDDISDLLEDAPDMGKPDGNDIVEGNFTLPVIYAMEEDKTGQLRGLLENAPDLAFNNDNMENMVKAREAASAGKGPKLAKQKANEFIDKAQTALLELPSGATTKIFGEALDYLTGRLENLVR